MALLATAPLTGRLPSGQEPPLPRTAKGSVIRRAVAARYAGWLGEALSCTSGGGGGGGGDGGGCGAGGGGGDGAEAGAGAAGTVAPTGIADGADSLGLAALLGHTGGGGGGGRLPTSAAELAADTLQQHIKVCALRGVHACWHVGMCTAYALRVRLAAHQRCRRNSAGEACSLQPAACSL